MIDYYPFILRAVQAAANHADEQARRDIYIRAWRIVTDELRVRRPPATKDELHAHRAAIQSAIERIEHEYSSASVAPAPERAMPRREPAIEISDDSRIDLDDRYSQAPSRSRRGVVAAVAAVLLVAIGVGGYAVWSAWTTMPPKPAVTPAAKIEAALHDPPLRRKPVLMASTADLAPGVDGGSTDADVPLIYRRQRVFYRTTFPTGTIVVDKPQHFIYLVLPNSVALRYGIGVGTPCAEVVGPKQIARKAEWPAWTPPPGSSKTDPMPGGPGNPLGARLLDLDDSASRIHGTNAPKTIGEDVALGCVRLVNDDVADLYNRVPVGTRVVMR